MDNEEFNEIVEIAREISYEQDSHKYLLKVIERLGYKKSVGYSKIIDFVSEHDKWEEYVLEIFNWLTERVPQVREGNTEPKLTEALVSVK
ncbi:MAG: hypothetical protein QNJ72_42810 [Pleurocapsa sp. MO_226.B13]|nr:hypothetical protein [Pleurocapsa sp. MO_226.B13]